MRYRGNKHAHLSVRNKPFKSQTSNLAIELDLDQFNVLKKEAKRIEIMTRMENRLKSKDQIRARARPQSVMPRGVSRQKKPNFKVIQQQYFRQKSLVNQALKTKEEPRPSEEGLLGQIKRYEQMNKQQLIEKLISLQHLANTIFKRNKFLEEELRKYQVTPQP